MLGNLKIRIFHSSPRPGHVFMQTSWGNGLQDSKRLFSHYFTLRYITLHSIHFVGLHSIGIGYITIGYGALDQIPLHQVTLGQVRLHDIRSDCITVGQMRLDQSALHCITFATLTVNIILYSMHVRGHANARSRMKMKPSGMDAAGFEPEGEGERGHSST